MPVPGLTGASLSLRARWKSDGPITSVAWGEGADGQPLLATTNYHWEDPSVRIWSPDGRPVTRIACLSSARVAWEHADGRPVLAIGDSGGVRVWEADAEESARVLDEVSAQAVAWGHGPGGQPLLAAGGRDGRVRIWDPGSGSGPRLLLRHPLANLSSLAWGHLPGGRPVLVGGAGYSVTVWDPFTEEVLHTSGWDPETPLWSVACARRSDGPAFLATGHYDGTVRIWAYRDGAFGHDSLTADTRGRVSVAWAPLADGRLMLATVTRHKLQLWNGSTRLPLADPLDIADGEANDVACALAPDGRLLLAVASERAAEIRVYDVTLDPPARPPASAPAQPPAGARNRDAGLGQTRPVTLLSRPEEAALRFAEAAAVDDLDCVTTRDGRVLLATCAISSKQVRIWDLLTGDLAAVLEAGSAVRGVSSVAWARMPDGTILLAAGTQAGDTRVWTWEPGEGIGLPGTAARNPGAVARTPGAAVRVPGAARVSGGSVGVAWGYLPDGLPLLAASDDDSVTIWSPATGQVLRTIGFGVSTGPVLWGHDSEGRLVFATWTWESGEPNRIWDPLTGRPLRIFSNLLPLAWGRHRDGRPAIAARGGDAGMGVGIADPDTEQFTTVLTRRPNISTATWGPGPAAGHLLATTSYNGPVEVWDTAAGAQFTITPAHGSPRTAAAWAVTPDGDVLLVVAIHGRDHPPAQIWRVATGAPAPGADSDVAVTAVSAVPAPVIRRPLPAATVASLLRLGSAGLWLPLGLLDDLIVLTGPAGSAGSTGSTGPDGGGPDAGGPGDWLGSLGREPGVARLRALGWPADARAALAALLAGGMAIPAQYTPPPSAPPGALRDALHQTLNGGADERGDHDGKQGGPGHGHAPGHGNGPGQGHDHGSGHGYAGGQMTAPRWTPPVPELRAAADGVTDQTAALLRILGPAACTADPLLPLRLAHRIAELPALSSRELTLLSPPDAHHPARPRPAPTTAVAHAPGSADIARTGPFTRLLPTELALPRTLMSVRLATNQLLYRRHEAPAPPAPAPVAIVLDTTPPTWGPAGTALRLAAHLLTLTLWEHGRQPDLVTLDAPGALVELRSPADLLRLWTGATLADPATRIAAALDTVSGTGRPAVFCTHFHTAFHASPPSAATRLLTAHHPPEKPPPSPASPWHAHLPSAPTRAELAAAIAQLLIPDAADGRP